MPVLKVSSDLIDILLAIEQHRAAWAEPSWVLTMCEKCGNPLTLRNPGPSHHGIVSWLCTTCGYFESHVDAIGSGDRKSTAS